MQPIKTPRAVLLFSFLCGAAAAQTNPFPVWVSTSLERTGVTSPAGPNGRVSVSAAKGETESFQINVKSPAAGLTITNVSASDLIAADGRTLSRNSYTFYTEHYVYVSQASPNWQGSNQPLGPGWYADGLIPFTNPATGAPISTGTYRALPVSVQAGNNRTFWVDVTVPRAAAAGTYNGSITVVATAGTVTIPVTLTVWNFALPLKPSQQSSFIFMNGAYARLDWYQELLRHRLMPLVVSNCAVQIGTGLPANSCAGDAQMQRTLIDNSGLSTTSLRFWSGGTYTNCVAPAPPSVSTIAESAKTHQPDLSLYNYSFDEIDNCPNLSTMIPVIQQWARNLHQAGVRNLITMAPTTAALPLLTDGAGKPAVDIWTVLPVMYDGAVSNVAQAKQAGSEIWSYNTLVQDSYSPKWLVDFAPINFRIQPGFIHQSLGITGLLYWALDRWTTDPWTQINTTNEWNTSNYPGEGVLFYPGDAVGLPGGITPSMRIKWLRDGMDDYDYVEILKTLGQGDWATTLSKSVGQNWTNWTRDINAVYSVREQLGARINQLNAGPPTIVSLSPNAASGSAATFQIVYGNPVGATEFSRVELLLNTTSDTRNACWVSYDPVAKTVSLATDGALSTTSAAVGATTMLQNTQCSVAPWAVFVNTSGEKLSLALTVNFKSVFKGARTIYLKATSKSGLSTGFQNLGTWNVTATTGPAAVSVTPNSGAGTTAKLQVVFTDSAGALNLIGGHVLVNKAVDGRSACWIWYDRRNNTISLASNDTLAWKTGLVGSATTLQNSQCVLDLSGSSTVLAGTALTLNVPVTFLPAFAGSRNIYLDAVNPTTTSPYVSRGVWTVQ